MTLASIVSWNCRGLHRNIDDLKNLMRDYNPMAICLQETLTTPTKTIDFRKYHSFHHHATPSHGRPAGGVTTMILKSTPQRQIQLNTTLQAIAVTISLQKTITICNVYLPPGTPITQTQLDNLTEQLPQPFLLVGDLNAHNPIWDCKSALNSKGKLIEALISRNQLCIWNKNEATYIHPATGSLSTLDLALCSGNIFLDYSFEVHDDLCGSDHFPIFLFPTQQRQNDHVQRWKLNRADWPEFRRLCDQELTPELMSSVNDDTEIFTSSLLFISEITIPKTSAVPKKLNKPWWNDECQEALDSRKRALNKFKKRPTSDNLDSFKKQYARARRIIRGAMRDSWKTYVSKLNNRTSSKKVWDMVRKITGKGNPGGIKQLVKDGEIITNVKDISNTLAGSISHNSSSAHYTPEFQRHKQSAERRPLQFKSHNSENYNRLFMMRELTDALKDSHDTAVGPDQIHYQILKHLPQESMSALLQIFNNIWVTGSFPDSWRQATVIPIPKPGKDHTDPTNYRPIALTSCVCKTFERMVNRRLVWYLEKHCILTAFQSGFRKKRSTIDQIITLESVVREAFIQREHSVAIFFDLEKAYDTTWKYGIMKDLHEAGLRGRLPIFIDNFLQNRQFSVRIGATLSDLYDQEEGVPQGSILAVTCFIMKINGIVKCLLPGMQCSLYVDDFLITYTSKNMQTIERQLQLCLNKIQEWAQQNGFRFSRTKTVCMHFCNLPKLHPEPELSLDGTVIPLVNEFKFLGVIFDRKLSFIPHIKYIKAKCQKSLNLLKVVSRMDWGADSIVLLRLYRALIRSKLDYGCIVYGSARQSYIAMLDTIHHQGLRICLGAFRTSPVQSLYVEADEESLCRRREKLSIQYGIRIKSTPQNPVYKTIFHPKCGNRFGDKPNTIPTFGIRLKILLDNCNIDTSIIAPNNYYAIPLWNIPTPLMRYDLKTLKKSDTNPIEYIARYNDIRNEFSDYDYIYTDGSVMDDKVGCAAVYRDQVVRERLPDKASIYTAELRAISLALDLINTSASQKFVIFCDSLSVLQGLQNLRIDNSMIFSVIRKYMGLPRQVTIVFVWLPSHVGIQGNELADQAAKSALDRQVANIQIPYTDLNRCAKSYVRSQWQLFWDEQEFNKLHAVNPQIGPTVCRPSRREDIILHRIRIGHTYLTHGYLLRGEPAPWCLVCRDTVTVKHLLLDCVMYAHIRDNLFNEATLSDLFSNVAPDYIYINF